jgi:PPOX class probable F420-dependent enzyme
MREPTQSMIEFLSEPRIATLGSIGPHGPHLAPIWFEYTDGEFLFITPAASQKARNLDRDPRAGISVEAREPTRAVMANGRALIEPLTDLSVLARMAARYYGSTERGQQYADEAPNHDRILIRVRPEHWLKYGSL